MEISKTLHKLEGGRYLYFELDMTLTLMCDLDLINEL